MKGLCAVLASLVLAIAIPIYSQTPNPAQTAKRLPVIDVHLHSGNGIRNKQTNCGGDLQEFAPRDGRATFGVNDVRSLCNNILVAPPPEQYETMVLQNLEELNITGVTSGPLEVTERWRAKMPSRVIPSMGFSQPGNPSVAQFREWIKSGRVKVIGENAPQYNGIGPDHPSVEPYWALAEELDVPIAIHVGLGAPAANHVGQPAYLASLSNPLLLEPVLRRHPRLRIQVMHAGWPMLDAMIAMMYSHPQIYVDTGIIDWGIPRKEFYTYLQRLVEAGFGNRVMYGSDQFFHPEAMRISIEAIEKAPFLTEKQKRDILYNNAVRFLRLDQTKTN